MPSARAKEDLTLRVDAAKKALADRIAAMADREAQWKKDVLAAYNAGKLNWKDQRPFEAHSQNGAKLTIYNDEPIDFRTYYDGGSQLAERKPGGGVVVASGPDPDTETYTVSFRPGEGTWTTSWAFTSCRKTASRASASRAVPIARENHGS